MPKARRLPWLIPGVITGSLVPFADLLERALTHRLGANPIATLLNQLGLLALVFLWSSLSCTPLKLAFGWTWPMKIRKTLGLFAFFCALAHFSVYFVLDQNLALGSVIADVIKRPVIWVGFLGLLALLPLALTSTRASVTRLGFARWKRIHQLVYPAALFVAVHFYLRVKADHGLPLAYAALLGALLAVRLAAFIAKSRAMAQRKQRAS
jgi:sulfoxide reductase heme-binding subunit YedZ